MSSVEENLLQNVHEGLSCPTIHGISYLVKGTYRYYHYGCDGFMDKGWGCGYRTLQTLCSWVRNTTKSNVNVPSIIDIQKLLVTMEDKPDDFIGSRDWIGSVEVCLVIDQLYNIPSKILHVNKGHELNNIFQQLVGHFQVHGSPLMMGGDQDCSSKGIMGVHMSDAEIYLLIVDPHFIGTVKSAEQLHEHSWVKWQKLSDFIDSSFYNICLPQLTYDESFGIVSLNNK